MLSFPEFTGTISWVRLYHCSTGPGEQLELQAGLAVPFTGQ